MALPHQMCSHILRNEALQLLELDCWMPEAGLVKQLDEGEEEEGVVAEQQVMSAVSAAMDEREEGVEMREQAAVEDVLPQQEVEAVA